MSDLILASSSPRRREMLEWLQLDFEVVPSRFDEASIDTDEVEELVEELALQKALAVAKDRPDEIVIAADTLVALDGRPIGKARDRQHAIEILQQLSGTTHAITTGVAIIDPIQQESIVFHTQSLVTFRELKSQEIDEYLDTALWQDKAGAYAVQEDPGQFVLGYDGSYTNIMGLPLLRVVEELERCGIETTVDIVSTIEAMTGQREI